MLQNVFEFISVIGVTVLSLEVQNNSVKKIYVSVCKNTILSNLKNKTNHPAIRVSEGKHGKPARVHKLHHHGDMEVCMDMEKPMPWGARVWLELS